MIISNFLAQFFFLCHRNERSIIWEKANATYRFFEFLSAETMALNHMTLVVSHRNHLLNHYKITAICKVWINIRNQWKILIFHKICLGSHENNWIAAHISNRLLIKLKIFLCNRGDVSIQWRIPTFWKINRESNLGNLVKTFMGDFTENVCIEILLTG
jgi:hypothetical protein